MTDLRIVSLFSGIGGLERGLEAGLADAGLRARTTTQVECNPYVREVLAREWPHAKRFDDVRTVDGAKLGKIDVMIGGSPCVDISLSGKRGGFAAPRSGLWVQFTRLIDETAPPVVVWENVPGALCPHKHQRAAIATVLEDFRERGYDALWIVVPAAVVGAPHLRRRLFVIAWRPEALTARRAKPARTPPREPTWPAAPGRRAPRGEPAREIPAASAIPFHMERIEAVGNCVVPPVGYVVGRIVAALYDAHGSNGPGLLRRVAGRALAWTRALTTAPAEHAITPNDVKKWLDTGIMRAGRVITRGDAPELCDPGCEEQPTGSLWPTPTARDWRSGKAGEETRARNARPLSETAAPEGFLNPDWVDMLGGFPVGYTRLDATRLTPRKRGSKPCTT